MRFYIPTSFMCLLAQAPVDPAISGLVPLAEKYGTWIIWLAIAIYLFKRSEIRDENDKKDRQTLLDAERAERAVADKKREDNYTAFMKVQSDALDESKALLTRVVLALEASNQSNQALAKTIKGKCRFQMDPETQSE